MHGGDKLFTPWLPILKDRTLMDSIRASTQFRKQITKQEEQEPERIIKRTPTLPTSTPKIMINQNKQ